MREGDEMKPKIIRSQIVESGNIRVEWNNGDYFVYDTDLHLIGWRYDRSDDWGRIERVSRTSARETLNGCGVQKVRG